MKNWIDNDPQQCTTLFYKIDADLDENFVEQVNSKGIQRAPWHMCRKLDAQLYGQVYTKMIVHEEHPE